jgi:iron complex transport system substrate-binding protein
MIFIFTIMAVAGRAEAGTVVDAAGRSVTAQPGAKLLVLGGGITESVYALGLGGQVVSVDTTSIYPPEVMSLPRVNYYRQLTAESLLAQDPDLVIAPDDAGPPGVIDQVRSAGVPVALLPSAHSLDGARQRIRMLGQLLDRVPEAEKLAQGIDQAMAGVKRPVPPPRVLFIYAGRTGGMQVAGQDTAADAMISLCGGTNAVQGFTGYRPLTAEAVIAARPDVVVLPERVLQTAGGPDGLLTQPGLSLTPAGKSRRIVSFDDLFLLGFGPRTGAACTELSSALAP